MNIAHLNPYANRPKLKYDIYLSIGCIVGLRRKNSWKAVHFVINVYLSVEHGMFKSPNR